MSHHGIARQPCAVVAMRQRDEGRQQIKPNPHDRPRPTTKGPQTARRKSEKQKTQAGHHPTFFSPTRLGSDSMLVKIVISLSASARTPTHNLTARKTNNRVREPFICGPVTEVPEVVPRAAREESPVGSSGVGLSWVTSIFCALALVELEILYSCGSHSGGYRGYSTVFCFWNLVCSLTFLPSRRSFHPSIVVLCGIECIACSGK